MVICLLKDAIPMAESDLEPVSVEPIDETVMGSKRQRLENGLTAGQVEATDVARAPLGHPALLLVCLCLGILLYSTR
jgi:hypothetical protein